MSTSTSAAPAAAQAAAPEASSKPGRGRRTGRAIVVTMLAAAIMGISSIAASAPASASYTTLNVDAACGHRAVRAESGRLTGYTGWAMVWSPALYRYTSSGWQRYLVGGTQTQYAESWDIGQITFSNLPTGWYYQVRATYQWVFNGRPSGSLHVNEPVAHHLDGLAVNMTWNEQMYSTNSYCYVG